MFGRHLVCWGFLGVDIGGPSIGFLLVDPLNSPVPQSKQATNIFCLVAVRRGAGSRAFGRFVRDMGTMHIFQNKNSLDCCCMQFWLELLFERQTA